jgi:hypothetical protein
VNRQTPLDRRRAACQDVLDAPETMVAEILRGDLPLRRRPASRHAFAGGALPGELTGPFQRGGPGGRWIVAEPELRLGEEVVASDLAGWRRERMPVYPDAPAFTLAPDRVCEILSPSTRTRDMTVKRDIHAEKGVAHLWRLDPDARTLEAFLLRKGEWVLTGTVAGDRDVGLAPSDAIAFPLGALWPPEACDPPA